MKAKDIAIERLNVCQRMTESVASLRWTCTKARSINVVVFNLDCTLGLRRCDRWRHSLILQGLHGYIHGLSTTHRPPLFFVTRFDYFLMANAIAKTAVANFATVSRRVRLPLPSSRNWSRWAKKRIASVSLKTSARSTVQTTLSFKYRLFQNR